MPPLRDTETVTVCVADRDPDRESESDTERDTEIEPDVETDGVPTDAVSDDDNVSDDDAERLAVPTEMVRLAVFEVDGESDADGVPPEAETDCDCVPDADLDSEGLTLTDSVVEPVPDVEMEMVSEIVPLPDADVDGVPPDLETVSDSVPVEVKVSVMVSECDGEPDSEREALNDAVPNDGVPVPLTLRLRDSDRLPVPEALCDAVKVPKVTDSEPETERLALDDVDRDSDAVNVPPEAEADADAVSVPADRDTVSERVPD